MMAGASVDENSILYASVLARPDTKASYPQKRPREGNPNTVSVQTGKQWIVNSPAVGWQLNICESPTRAMQSAQLQLGVLST